MAIYQDGAYPSGAPTLTINSVTYVCDAFSLEDASNVVDVTNASGEHAGAISIKGKTTGSATLQLATSTTVAPTTAAAAATTGVFTLDSATYFITSVSKPRPKDGYWTVSINFQKRENAV